MIVPQYEDFKKENSSSRHALLTIILVYHGHLTKRENRTRTRGIPRLFCTKNLFRYSGKRDIYSCHSWGLPLF